MRHSDNNFEGRLGYQRQCFVDTATECALFDSSEGLLQPLLGRNFHFLDSRRTPSDESKWSVFDGLSK